MKFCRFSDLLFGSASHQERPWKTTVAPWEMVTVNLPVTSPSVQKLNQRPNCRGSTFCGRMPSGTSSSSTICTRWSSPGGWGASGTASQSQTPTSQISTGDPLWPQPFQRSAAFAWLGFWFLRQIRSKASRGNFWQKRRSSAARIHPSVRPSSVKARPKPCTDSDFFVSCGSTVHGVFIPTLQLTFK